MDEQEKSIHEKVLEEIEAREGHKSHLVQTPIPQTVKEQWARDKKAKAKRKKKRKANRKR